MGPSRQQRLTTAAPRNARGQGESREQQRRGPEIRPRLPAGTAEHFGPRGPPSSQPRNPLRPTIYGTMQQPRSTGPPRGGGGAPGGGGGGGPPGGGGGPPGGPEGNDTREFLEQLQLWAAATVCKDLAQLEAEFARLQAQPKPEPSAEFVRNPQLNRYRDVLCVENNRAILQSGRYIHANWIDSNGERRFLCTQGPMANTVDDFWQLVVQERIDAVVMLCDTVEMGRPKCCQYWPQSEDAQIQSADGNVKVQFVNEEKLDGHLFKTRLQVTIENLRHRQYVRHFHWRQWPDRGVPLNHLAALRLLHYLNPCQRVLVHCSAGIGRTGTIVAIYLAQNKMRAGQPLDIYELIRELRQQRAGSVQTLDQYLYIYSVLLRYAKNKAERGHIQLDQVAADRVIQAIAGRIYRMVDGNQ